jgi:TonB family protein
VTQSGLFTVRSARRFQIGPGGAFLISLLFHALLLGWVQFGGAAKFFVVPASEAALASPASPRSSQSLEFTFVDVPEDREVPENARARLLSDKTREASQKLPTPPDASELGPDPHSEGNSPLRQVARPGAPAPPPVPRGMPSPRGAGRRSSSVPGGPVAGGEAQPGEGEQEEAGASRREGTAGKRGEETGTGEDRREAFRKALSQLESGTYDFSTFDNSAYLQGGNYGTLSFDTKGFDWGDYARQLYLIIKKNWYDRIPIAAYYGQKGKVFIRFVIERDGSVTDLAVIRSSDIPPFDLAAENAIRASHPLPALPSNFPKEREGVTFGFYYNLPIDQP